jgi:hypothetical protein
MEDEKEVKRINRECLLCIEIKGRWVIPSEMD